jgi:hypothetical protein
MSECASNIRMPPQNGAHPVEPWPARQCASRDYSGHSRECGDSSARNGCGREATEQGGQARVQRCSLQEAIPVHQGQGHDEQSGHNRHDHEQRGIGCTHRQAMKAALYRAKPEKIEKARLVIVAVCDALLDKLKPTRRRWAFPAPGGRCSGSRLARNSVGNLSLKAFDTV